MRNYNRASSGYIGWSESIRSHTAKECGIYPKTQFKKEYHISEKLFQEILAADGFDEEWHHTSKYFNKTNFYKWNETGIEMLACKDFDKHFDTIIAFMENADEYFVNFESWYEDLWEHGCQCIPLIDLVRDFMFVEQDDERRKIEDERLRYINIEWTLRWAANTGAAVRSLAEGFYFNINNGLIFYCFPGDEHISRVLPSYELKKEVLDIKSWQTYVLEEYKKCYGVCGSVSIQEFIYRSEVARLYRSLSSYYKPDEKIHRHAASEQFNRHWIKNKYNGTSDEQYALALYDYYHSQQ